MQSTATQESVQASVLRPFTHRLLLDEKDPAKFRVALKDYFLSTHDRYESLFQTLGCREAWYERAIPLRHPLIFYFGHTATFFINKLILARLVENRLNPHLESIFAVGVDEMSWDDLNDAHYDWPEVEEVQAYRDEVRRIVTDIIDHAPLTLPVSWTHPWWGIVMGIEHERIHVETSSVLIRQQRLEYIQPHPDWQPNHSSGAAPENSYVEIPSGAVSLGRSKDDTLLYGWDNEFGSHEAEVPAFQASRLLVSNGEYRGFVKAGGYEKKKYWDEEGAEWLDYSKVNHPEFWVEDGQDWGLRLMTGVVDMPWNWPVEVNAHEARAFCRWKSTQTGQPIRLPSEDEWRRMLEVSGYQYGDDANFYLDHGASSTPVDTFPHGPFCSIVGNVWQWTETPIYPYNNFEIHPYYDDFTTPTYDDRHAIMKGGSWISGGNEAEPDSRYAFRRHFFQHCGFRYIVSSHTPPPPSHYETDRLLSEYAEFHYGANYFGVENFSHAIVERAMKALGNEGARARALDIGCASGRATFELARYFDFVTGLDFSARFIRHGVTLAQEEPLRYLRAMEGELTELHEVTLKELGLDGLGAKVEFFQADACNLKPQFGDYDFVLAANLVDRLYEPAKFLDSIHERMTLGGVLMIATPGTWMVEHTPREHWLGGFKRDGENVTTLDGIREHLSAHFEQLGEVDEQPFIIRETQRKFQHVISQISYWRRVK